MKVLYSEFCGFLNHLFSQFLHGKDCGGALDDKHCNIYQPTIAVDNFFREAMSIAK